MAPRRGITVSPGIAIDFSALARPAPPSPPLLPRATSTTSSTVWGVIILIALIATGLGLIFCAVVLVLICRNKRKRSKRQKEMEAKVPAGRHEYRVVQDLEADSSGVYELGEDRGLDGREGGQRVELPIEGFVAAPKPSAQPVELHSEGHGYEPVRR